MDGGAMAEERVWVLADDRAGNVVQVVGVAEALAEPFAVRDIRYDQRGRWANLLRGASLIGVDRASRAAFQPPWPRLVIGAGRRTAPIARWLKRVSGCRLVQIMDPGWPGRGDFDLIAQPMHDGGSSAVNVIETLGSCHRVSPSLLATEGARWAPRLAHLPRPYLLVVVGGDTKDYAFPPERGRELAKAVGMMHGVMGGSVLLTTSRRTTPDLGRSVIRGMPSPRHIYEWSEGTDNPYHGFLALADCVVVTGDSMNMCSEACATPAPVHIFAPPGLVNRKHARLHQLLFEKGYARPLDGEVVSFVHPPLNAAMDVAAEIRRRGLL
jgi:hypothetical protein